MAGEVEALAAAFSSLRHPRLTTMQLTSSSFTAEAIVRFQSLVCEGSSFLPSLERLVLIVYNGPLAVELALRPHVRRGLNLVVEDV